MVRRIYVKLHITLLRIPNIEALALVVSEKKILSVFPIIRLAVDDASGRVLYGPQEHGWQVMKRTAVHQCYTQNMEVLGLVVSEKTIFSCMSNCKSMGANDPWVGSF